MLRVGDRPILQYAIDALREVGIRDIVIVVGYQRERIQTYFEDGAEFGVNITYQVQRKQLGTGHALMSAREHLDGDFAVVPGDKAHHAPIDLEGLAQGLALAKQQARQGLSHIAEAQQKKFDVWHAAPSEVMWLAEYRLNIQEGRTALVPNHTSGHGYGRPGPGAGKRGSASNLSARRSMAEISTSVSSSAKEAFKAASLTMRVRKS